MTAQPSLKVVPTAQPKWDENLRLWLEKHIAEHPHLTTTVLARPDRIGGSRATLDAYLAGTYFQPKDLGGYGVEKSGLEDKIRAYREKVEGTERHGFVNSFIETRAWQQFLHACKIAVEEKVIVVAYGDPGVGKSRSMQEYLTRGMATAPIQILCSRNITTRYFVQKIAEKLNVNKRHPTAELEDKIAEKLKKQPRVIMVDQANYLKETALGSLCYWWDIARIPIVLIGTQDLHDVFMSSDLTQDVRAQITSRVAMHYRLIRLSKEDVKAIAKRALGEDATDSVVAKIYEITNGNHRHVDMLVPRFKDMRRAQAANLAAGKTTLEAILDTAGTRLMVD
jgi:DNA transposition AAA+ family ATPase